MVVVGGGVFECPVGQDCRLDIDDRESGSPMLALPEPNNTLTRGMDSLIFANNNILPALPLEPSLPSNDIIRMHFLAPEIFQSMI